MRVKGLTRHQLVDALNTVNSDHGYQLQFNRGPEQKGNFLHFTIRSAVSGVAGSRVSASGRRLTAASWHAHGYLFEAILEINPDAVIVTALSRITKDGGNWEDYNVGSLFNPVYASETSIK